MSPLVAYHDSPRRHRAGIHALGLIPNRPSAANPHGVYVFRDDHTHVTRRYVQASKESRPFHLRWTHQPGHDLWEVAYIGPLGHDRWVENGFVLYERATVVTLVIGHN